MENQEINSRLAAIESDIKVIPEIKAGMVAIKGDIVALQDDIKAIPEIRGEIKSLEKDVSYIKEDISSLKEGQVRLELAIAELQKGQSEVSGMLKLLVALPETVEKQGRRISWLYGVVAVIVVFVSANKYLPW